MIKVSHRGNTEGRKKELENDPTHIRAAVEKGYHCEVDVWLTEQGLFLGHDEPTYPVSITYLMDAKLICHAKNIEALHKMLEYPQIHCFWHEGDECAITSKKYVWKYPEVYFKGKLWGICSDWL
tara:strand:+ start:10251 stop:10622 length:372 start_codon:yes stop_codon:yes gene_type:complete